MTVWVLMIGYTADVVRVFTTKEAAEKACDDYPDKVTAIEEAQLEGNVRGWLIQHGGESGE